MKNIFDSTISVYNGMYDTTGNAITLRTFLVSQKYKDDVLRLRSTKDKEGRDRIKKRLPQACVSGLFSPSRKATNLVKHSGAICIDIDGKDNVGLDMNVVKSELQKLPQVAYVSFSASGKGLFVIIPLKYPDWHRLQFKQLQLDFANMGIVIDPACGDVARMRCYSYDSNPYINENAILYEGYYTESVLSESKPVIHDDVLEKISRCCDVIDKNGIDITGDYHAWFTICSALASLGEDGRYFFHVCSRQNPNYNRDAADRKFSSILRTNKRIGVGSFFSICLMYGITYI